MRRGFDRLQAMVRSRQLHSSFMEMRVRIMSFQSRCRGYLARREYKIKLGAIITIQAGFRKVLAQKLLVKKKQEVRFDLILKFRYCD